MIPLYWNIFKNIYTLAMTVNVMFLIVSRKVSVSSTFINYAIYLVFRKLILIYNYIFNRQIVKPCQVTDNCCSTFLIIPFMYIIMETPFHLIEYRHIILRSIEKIKRCCLISVGVNCIGMLKSSKILPLATTDIIYQ